MTKRAQYTISLVSFGRMMSTFAPYGKAFPKTMRVRAYDHNIYNGSTSVVRVRSEADQKEKRANRATFEMASWKTTQFVLAVVADT